MGLVTHLLKSVDVERRTQSGAGFADPQSSPASGILWSSHSSLFLTIASNLQVRRCWQSFNFQKENKNSKGVHALCLGLYRAFSEVPCTAGHLHPSDHTSMQMQIVLERSAFTCAHGQSKSSATNRQENRHEETASGACFSS